MKSKLTARIGLLSLVFLNSVFQNFVGGSTLGKEPVIKIKKEPTSVCFIENKGQVVDQNSKLRPDVLFSGTTGNMSFHIKQTGISYQLTEVGSWKKISFPKGNFQQIKEFKIPQECVIHRVDLQWVNPDKDFTIVKDAALPGKTNYYGTSPSNEVSNVTSFEGIWIKNLYKKINAHYYSYEGKLKCDYVVSAGANYKDLAWRIDGAELQIDQSGNLIMMTKAGTIQEGKPIVYQGNKALKSSWILTDNVLSIKIDNYNPKMEMIIDPLVRSWGTYYGGNFEDEITSCTKDAFGNLFVCGLSASFNGTSIATIGSHQQVIGGIYDAFLAKLNSSGTRIWSTYYGGSQNDYAWSIACDNLSNIYITGETSSSDFGVIATLGSHQFSYGGGVDAFLAKFDNNGLRLWGTYYGDAGNDRAFGVAVGPNSFPVIVGETNSASSISTATAHQIGFGGGSTDAFVALFSDLGVNQFGSYYGGIDDETAFGVSVDNSNNIIFGGQSSTTTANIIATAGSHQDIHGGGLNDGFVVKFNSAGVRQWGSYYGGAGEDVVYNLHNDQSSNIIFTGSSSTNTGTSIATLGSYQFVYGGGTSDGFVSKLDPLGIRLWGSYFGGSLEDNLYGIDIDVNDSIYVSGSSFSNNGIATPNAYEPNYNGNSDAIFAKFSPLGNINFGSYYGSVSDDISTGICIFPDQSLYIVGKTQSATDPKISTAGSHQQNFDGIIDGFIAKFFPCEEPVINPSPDIDACNNQIFGAIGFAANLPNTTFQWIKKSTSSGQATNIANSGSGNIPAFTATNTTCVILVDSIIVTPINKLNSTDSCFGISDTFLINTLPTPSTDQIRDSSFCHGQAWLPPAFNSGACTASVTYRWVKRSGPGGTTIPGLANSGVGNLPLINIINPPPSCLILTDTIKVIAYYKTVNRTDSCAGPEMKFVVKSVPSPSISTTRDSVYCTGTAPQGFSFTTSCIVGTQIRWRKTTVGGSGNSGTSIALNGNGSIPSFTTNNPGITILTDTIFVNSTFVSVGDSCIGQTDTFLLKVIPNTSVNRPRDTIYCHGSKAPTLTFTGPFFGANYKWTRSGANIGIAASGTDSIPMFIVNNTTNAVIVNTITVTPCIRLNGVECGNQPIQFNISAYPQAVAKCKPINVDLNGTGIVFVNPSDIDNGSTGTLLSVSQSILNCSNIGMNLITLTVTDSCSNSATCIATVTVRDLLPPSLFCIDQLVNLQPTSCDTRFNYLPLVTDNCNLVDVMAQDTAKYGVGKIIAPGVHRVCYTAVDGSNNTATCCVTVTVKVFSNPVGSLVCGDEIQISLDDNCSVTLSADMFLKGGPYRCYDEYKILVQLWNGGPYIDRNLNKKGIQLSSIDIGHVLKITILDTVSGNSCWGKATVEDKQAPKINCIPSIELTCDQQTDPGHLGIPTVIENCGDYTLNFVDVITKGNCTLGIDHWIRRTWTAIDNSGNKSYCSQLITVHYADIMLIEMPKDYNGYITQNGTYALICNNRYDPAFDLNKHIKPAQECIDDYLLDQTIYITTGRRVPRTLGWNIISSGPYYGHPNTESIYYPVHKDSFECWKSNEIIMWEGTGTPKIAGCANIGVSYSDQILNTEKPGCNAGPVGCYKLIRTWTILDWCTNQIRTHQQIIKVEDPEGPVISFPDTLDLLSNPFNCSAQWEAKNIWLSDNCSQELHYSLNISYGTVLGNETSGYILVDLPLGDQTLYIIAEDCCGNITEKKVLLRVIDRTPPTAVCQTKTVTSIVGNSSPNENYSLIKAASFDDGSFDNCAHQVYFKVIRMDELQGTLNGSNSTSNVCNNFNGDDNASLSGSQTYFDDDVRFCCADVNFNRMVVFRVFDIETGKGPINPTRMNQGGDLYGHFSDCMVEVSVQNKSNPTIVPPADVVVSCEYWLDLDKLADPKDSLLGKMLSDLTWRKKVITKDIVCQNFCVNNLITKYPGSTSKVNSAPYIACDFYNRYYEFNHPNNKYELIWGFDGYIISGCGANFEITIDDQRQCGQGKILRTYSTTGQNGQKVSASQIIWVVDCNPFYINPEDACDTLDDIVWPDCKEVGTYLYSCGANTSPDRIGKPTIVPGADDHCALIAIEHTDQIFTAETDACFVILRKWVVIDWCQYDPNINKYKGRWEFSQFIKVQDVEKPFVNCTVGICEPASLNKGTCYGHINLNASAADSCTPSNWLRFEYKIDLFNNGSIDYQVGSLNKFEFDAGTKPSIRNNPDADNVNNPFNASGTYPIGRHRIIWYVTDGCGNTGICSNIFDVKDCKAPTPYCLNGIITVPMPSTGCIDIWAKDLDYGSYDNCTSKSKLKFYFEGDTSMKSMRICCEDFIKKKINDELYIPVQMWVEDEEGNKDYCISIVVVQDNQNICPNVGTFVNINGELKTESGLLASQTKVDLYTGGQLVNSKLTFKDGKYVFTDLLENEEYRVKPSRTDAPVNGVSTADLVKIQKHILGKEMINSPYKLIASDVNNSNSITASDISEIRKLILGAIPTFTKVQSWKFIPASTTFNDVSAPWYYQTDAPVSMNAQNAKLDFIAIKMGDVNESAVVDLQSKPASRTNQKLNLWIDDQAIESNQTYSIEFKVQDLLKVQGLQFTLHFNPEVLSYENFESGLIELLESNFGLNKVNEGKLTMSWNTDQLLTMNPNQLIFKLKFKALRNSNLKNNLLISSEITEAEYYNEELEAHPIELMMRSSSGMIQAGIFELIGAIPNPWSTHTEIQFRLPEASAIRCSIYDATGRIVRIIPFDAKKGLNSINVNKADLNETGIYYYQLDSKDYSVTGKLIMINE
ncbi:MAG: T9SS type A sorting domain-containing protein [Saprospiraceae bacterium]